MDPRQPVQSQHLSAQMTQRQHQRFSWQAPLQEEAPAYEQTQQRTPQHQTTQPQVSPEESSQRHFSYAQTPNELRAFVYTSSPNDPPLPQCVPISLPTSPYTPIDPRPQSLLNPQLPTTHAQLQTAYVPPSHLQDDKPPVSPITAHEYPRTLPFSPVSPSPPQQPVQPAQINTQQSRHARQMSNLSPINTQVGQYPMPPLPPIPSAGAQTSPLPHKTPITPISAGSTKKDLTRDGPMSPSNRISYANEPYSPHGFTSNQTNNFHHAVFSPDAATGPNGLDFALHQPGQIAHPNMDSERSHKWNHSLCACSGDVSTCLTGLFCPCIVYGRTSYRLSQKSAKKDPTDMLGYSSTNGHCGMMSLSCGLWWLFPMLQRTRIRHAYKLEGGLGSDCIKGLCCCCCVAVQNEREVRDREEASRRWAGPASTDVYTRTSGMVYKPQQ
ncbi:PLAC8-domain-containing protein [Cucurbitaria berberidis CBS 394.84]|uniref:PLAC8-domain-containing protein n=1 Tax=Cucurbitaria berberidis CBS 394.84 TaxID=1168544 RepID=A0A9P4L9H9_9PLEO|nr:PLAC8-domain-containing protein [Cucurbitaria berberidis CBS 394.84]KAF1847040.1 PLAC8-domain-containing protein [Cucurbitaria berberidis CBS 394.84]